MGKTTTEMAVVNKCGSEVALGCDLRDGDLYRLFGAEVAQVLIKWNVLDPKEWILHPTYPNPVRRGEYEVHTIDFPESESTCLDAVLAARSQIKVPFQPMSGLDLLVSLHDRPELFQGGETFTATGSRLKNGELVLSARWSVEHKVYELGFSAWSGGEVVRSPLVCIFTFGIVVYKKGMRYPMVLL